MGAESGPYRLRCELRGHEEDVRGICICGDGGIATGSRDKTVRFWCVDETEKNRYTMTKTMVGHNSFVGPLAWIPANEQLPEGGLVSGGMDTLVFVWDLSTAQAVHTMKGHQLQVTGVTLDDQGDILSSSIDCTLRRWRNGHTVESWQAHQAPIQAILKLPSGEIATGSTDTTVKLWRGSTCLHTFVGHTDTVRGLGVMPNVGILSASHDGSIRLWALSGEALVEMVGHTSLVYSVAAHSSGVIASGSEDRFAKLWRDAACVQSIEHPGCVWDVKFLPNGDLVTACSDGIIRIWTTDAERLAGTPEVEAFEAQLSLYKSNTKTVGGIKVSELPGLEALQQPGTKSGRFQWPILGNLHLLLGGLPHRVLASLSLQYGPLMSLRLGSVLTLVVSTPDVAKEFLKAHDRFFASRPPAATVECLSYNYSGIAMSPYGLSWRHLRKFCVLQLLSPRRIEHFRLIREEEVSATIRSLINNSDRPASNISKTASDLTNAIICRMAFGKKYSDEDLIGGGGIHSVVKEIFLLVGSFDIGDYIPFLARMDLQGLYRRSKNVYKAQDYLLEKIIDEHVLQKNEPNAMPDLVDVLLAASADETMEFKITRDNIKSVINDMFLAGTDTASTTIEWTMSEVMRNPPVLKKLQDELERVVGMERMVTESDLPSLIYLQAVVKEAFRLHPAAPLAIPHISVEDCTVLGYEIPRGTRLLINVWAIGRNPKSWGEDAESFKPERFMGDGFPESKVENFEWIPFGAGRRGCPGQQLGTLIVEFAVAQLLHCFNWRLSNGQDLDMTEKFCGITLPREHELWAVLTPRLPIL